MPKKLFAIFATILLGVTFMPALASAALFHFYYSGADVTASGTLTADFISADTYHITGITGTRNGQDITSYRAGGPEIVTNSDFQFNNKLYIPTNSIQTSFVDLYGFVFQTNDGWFNIYYDGRYIEWGSSGRDISFNVAAVPIPAAAWLLGTGLVGLVALRRKKR